MMLNLSRQVSVPHYVSNVFVLWRHGTSGNLKHLSTPCFPYVSQIATHTLYPFVSQTGFACKDKNTFKCLDKANHHGNGMPSSALCPTIFMYTIGNSLWLLCDSCNSIVLLELQNMKYIEVLKIIAEVLRECVWPIETASQSVEFGWHVMLF
mgnify:CR=1 FL=1